MKPIKNERGSVIVFVTLMVVILLIMVGLGLDTGQLYRRCRRGMTIR
jgi:uncharacterized membrane protein